MLTDCWLNLLSFGGKCNDAPGNQCEKYKSFHLITVNACQTCHLRSFRGGGQGANHSPAWFSETARSSGRSCGRGTSGPSGAPAVRGTAVSRRSSGMWLGSGRETFTKRSFMMPHNATGTEDQHRIHNQLPFIFTIVPSHWMDTLEVGRTLIKKQASTESQTSRPDIQHLVTKNWFKLITKTVGGKKKN